MIGLLHSRNHTFIPWPVMEWHHVCFSYENNSSTITVLSNGGTHLERITLENLNKNPTELPSEFFNNLFIMRRANIVVRKKFFPGLSQPNRKFKSMFGKMTDVNIWNYSMTLEVMKSWTKCNSESGGGNVINWETAEWATWDLEVENVDKFEICQIDKKPGLTIFPRKRTFRESLELCQRLGGTMAVADSEKKSQEIMKLLSSTKDKICLPWSGGKSWTGYTDEKEEGKFVDVNTGEEMNWSKWILGEPNGGQRGNCVGINAEGKMFDAQCSSKYCTLCELEKVPVLHLRGACWEEGLDLNYTMKKEKEVMKFFGWRSTKLVWNETKWSFVDGWTQKQIAFTNNTNDYPVGVHKWYFVDGKCQDSKAKWRKMNLHGCKHTEFNCKSGDCVNMKNRCDRNYHCKDLSDEQNCTFVKPLDYDKTAAPPKILTGNIEDGKEELIDINISVDILDIIGVNEVESKLELRFRMEIAWNDDRLLFISLNDDDRKNIIDNFTDIWIPEIGFINVINPDQDNLAEKDKIIITAKTNNGFLARSTDLEKNFIYKGNTFRISKKSTFVGSFLCSFDNIYRYPFDTESCSIKMVMLGRNYDFTKLVASNLRYKGKQDRDGFNGIFANILYQAEY